jgi:hypothetical protein
VALLLLVLLLLLLLLPGWLVAAPVLRLQWLLHMLSAPAPPLWLT